MTATMAALVSLACSMAVVAAQQAPADPPLFRVAVDGVSIDAVVTDRRGEIVRDLTAADFEIFQNGKPQKITFAEFVPVRSAARSRDRSVGVGPASPPPQPVGRDRAAREQVQRTMIVVVDDLGLSVQGIHDVRRGLRRFLSEDFLPTDLVAVVRTGASTGPLQSVTQDPEAVAAAVDALRYNLCSRKGASPLDDVVQSGMGPPGFGASSLQCMIPTAASLNALSTVIQAARDMPGRKAVIFASEGFGGLVMGDHPSAISDRETDVRDALDRAIDQATRSGVVIYTLDAHGLQTGLMQAADNVYAADIGGNTDALSGVVRDLAGQRRRVLLDVQQSLAYLAEQTGGFAVVNTNDLGAGLSRIGADVRDYYVVGYEPDPDTFRRQGKSPLRHTVEVKVKRPGLRVRARKAFIGVSDTVAGTSGGSARPPTHPEAITP